MSIPEHFLCNITYLQSVSKVLLPNTYLQNYKKTENITMKQPLEPNKEDCCNSGCNPCIFDVYEKQLKLYKSNIESGENCKTVSDTANENVVSQLEYRAFNVVKNIDLCVNHKLLLFKYSNWAPGKKVFWNPGEHFLVKYSTAKQSCTRAYTPISMDVKLNEDYDFAIIVKKYCNGLVSQYLCDLKDGDCTLWRGPYGHYQMESNKFSRLVMIAQGTGIAPFYSIIKQILNNEDDITRITLLYCCKCINSALLRDELYSLKSYWNFKYSIYLGESPDTSLLKYQEPISINRLTLKEILDLKPFTDKDQFLLCGSDEFMKQYSECLQEENVHKENIVII